MNLELFAPELSLITTAIAVILLDLFIQRKGLLAIISLVGLTVAAIFTIIMRGNFQAIFNNMLAVDGFALFFKLLFLGIVALVILASVDYVAKFARFRGEYYALLLLSALGMMLMAAGTDLIVVFLGLELMSISLYILVGFFRARKESNEASLKYLLLGAFATGFLLYGIALVYGSVGSTNLREVGLAAHR